MKPRNRAKLVFKRPGDAGVGVELRTNHKGRERYLPPETIIQYFRAFDLDIEQHAAEAAFFTRGHLERHLV